MRTVGVVLPTAGAAQYAPSRTTEEIKTRLSSRSVFGEFVQRGAMFERQAASASSRDAAGNTCICGLIGGVTFERQLVLQMSAVSSRDGRSTVSRILGSRDGYS